MDISKYIRTANTTFAHPHIDNDGSWITMGMNARGPRQYYEFLRYKSDPSVNESTNMCEKAEVIGRFPSSHFLGLSYFHSFAVTKNYIIFLEQALKLDLLTLVKNLIVNKPFSHALLMNKNFLTKIHIMNKKTGQVMKQKYVTESLFVFHHINAYEKGDTNEIFVDICAYDPANFDVTKFTREDIFTEKFLGSKLVKSIAKRITIPLLERQGDFVVYCQIRDLNSEVAFELPVINYAENNGTYYRYFYGTNNTYKLPYSVIKMDVETGETWEKCFNDGDRKYLPTEAAFVKNPNGTREDDGVLLVLVLSDEHDFLSILDAKDLKELARAEVSENVYAGFTFHGFFATQSHFPKLNQ